MFGRIGEMFGRIREMFGRIGEKNKYFLSVETFFFLFIYP
jgi:hypothetical protein